MVKILYMCDVSIIEYIMQHIYYRYGFCTTVDQRSGKWQSKNTTIFVGTIIYQLQVSVLIGHLQVGIQCQRKNIYYKYRYGGTRSCLQIYGVCGQIGVGTSMCSLGVYISWAREPN